MKMVMVKFVDRELYLMIWVFIPILVRGGDVGNGLVTFSKCVFVKRWITASKVFRWNLSILAIFDMFLFIICAVMHYYIT